MTTPIAILAQPKFLPTPSLSPGVVGVRKLYVKRTLGELARPLPRKE